MEKQTINFLAMTNWKMAAEQLEVGYQSILTIEVMSSIRRNFLSSTKVAKT